MGTKLYGNPEVTNVVNDLDIVILGATEIDTNFNVNVYIFSLFHSISDSLE